MPLAFSRRRLLRSLCFVLLFALPLSAGAGQVVSFSGDAPAGSIVIHARGRALFFVLGDGEAIRYAIAVPKRGKEWSGRATVAGKYVAPAWSPPRSVRVDHPELPRVIPGGAPENPMGARAILLDRAEVAIHGTTRKMRRSIGTAASYGCIRMRNEDVIDLFNRVDVGTPVLMVP